MSALTLVKVEYSKLELVVGKGCKPNYHDDSDDAIIAVAENMMRMKRESEIYYTRITSRMKKYESLESTPF